MLGTASRLDAAYLLVTILGTAVATFLAVWAAAVAPGKRARAEMDKEKAGAAALEQVRQARRDRFIDGVPADPGMTEAVLPAAVRLDNLANAVVDLTRRVDETNGTGRRSEGKIDLLLREKFPDVKVPPELQEH